MRVWAFFTEEKDIGINLDQKKEIPSSDWPEIGETSKEFIEQFGESL